MHHLRPALALLVMILGLAAFTTTGGIGPAVAVDLPAGAALQAAAPVAQAAALDDPVVDAVAEPVVDAVVEPVVEPSPGLAPAPAAEEEPAMRRTGSRDGWAVYRIGEGRVPDRLAVGRGFRGELTWLQGGVERRARVYVPRSAPASAPLLVSLHGLGVSLDGVERQQRWSSLAFQQRLVVVWGAGHKGSWNAGPCCGASAGKVDDLAYLDRLLQITGALQGIDRRRVHLAGYSNGGMLAYRYACGRPGRIAGILVVAATHTAPCTPRRATAVLSVHGGKDPTVPLAGTRYSRELRSALPPVRHGVRQFARTGAGVRSVVLPSFAHGWPTRNYGGYDATGEGWRFLKAHPKPR